jgi:predicted Ser/Thr protein kinase
MENELFGSCRLIRKIGEGGMGVVWLARHETLEKDVAIKVLPAGFADNEEAVQRFLHEARSAARLDHPNVVQVLDAGSRGGTPFIVMQYIDGTDLQKILKKKGKLEVADALAITKRVALALEAAHTLGIIHRDIKPANILLTKQGRVLVTDFGLARDIRGGASLTGSQEIMGTPQYLSPEQARGEKLDGRSDLYSLGGMCYALLTGRPPFAGATPVSIAVKHASPDERPEPVRRLVPEVPAEVEALVEKMLAKRAQDRFQTAAEVAQAIDRIKKGPGTMVTVAQEKVLTPERKRRLILTGVAAGLGGLVLIILLLALLGPGPAEKAFRAAGQAATETEKRVRYQEVAQHYPNTEWADKARRQISAMVEAELVQIKAAAFDGKLPFRDISGRFEKLRSTYPGAAKRIDQVDLEVERPRVITRTKEFAEALKNHKPWEKGGDKSERLKDFVSPEAIRKQGENGVVLWFRVVLAFLYETGGRPEEIDIHADQAVVQLRKEATVPVKAVLHRVKTAERTTKKYLIQWMWQEGDWYLGEKPLTEEK